ncbi:Uncharacterised protein [Mycobacteroides abscessus subsp. massiliense]|nr:Uncharacterised protein [Mycobacteroides abscessus subsp. massiliense]
MSFWVSVVAGAEPFEDFGAFTDVDAYLVYPGGALGVWYDHAGRSYIFPPGVWLRVEASHHSPGERLTDDGWVPAPYLHPKVPGGQTGP